MHMCIHVQSNRFAELKFRVLYKTWDNIFFFEITWVHLKLHRVNFKIDCLGLLGERARHYKWKLEIYIFIGERASDTLSGLNNGNRRYIYI